MNTCQLDYQRFTSRAWRHWVIACVAILFSANPVQAEFGQQGEPTTQPVLISQAKFRPSAARQRVESQITAIRESKPPSQSVGTLRSGQLAHPAELPKPEGIGYVISHPDRDTNFGADRMVFGLMRLGVTMHEHLGDESIHRMLVNEISDPDGGKQKRHINHQMGLDVDICFYASDLDGKPLRARWLSFDEKGLSPAKKLRFDTTRNWLLLESILSSDTFGEIRAVLVSEPLKKRLLNHAMSLEEKATGVEAERLREHIRRAMDLCRQPKSSPHDNHFHLSLEN